MYLYIYIIYIYTYTCHVQELYGFPETYLSSWMYDNLCISIFGLLFFIILDVMSPKVIVGIPRNVSRQAARGCGSQWQGRPGKSINYWNHADVFNLKDPRSVNWGSRLDSPDGPSFARTNSHACWRKEPVVIVRDNQLVNSPFLKLRKKKVQKRGMP